MNTSAQFEELRALLESNIIGQPQAIESIVGSIERFVAGLHDYKRPIASFMFLGPSGVGKTYLTEKLAELLLPADAFIRVDCAEFAQEQDTAKIYGAAPGYIGSDQGSYFTRLIEGIENPDYGFILLLDEIEKANPRFFDTWISVLDNGSIIDAKGKKLDFTRSMIFLTSNIGSNHFGDPKDIGFRPHRPSNINSLVTMELKKVFRPEFLNRISSVLYFYPLSREQEDRILDNLLDELNRRLAQYLVRVELGESLKTSIRQAGFSKEYGARELKRALVRLLETPLARALIREDIKKDSLVIAELSGTETIFSKAGDYPVLVEMDMKLKSWQVGSI